MTESNSKDFSTLIPDIQKMFDGHTLSAAVDKLGNQLAELIAKKFKRYGEEQGTPKLYLSNVGRPLRQLWYDLKGFKGEELEPEVKFKFLYGDLLEALVLFLAVESGHKVELLQHKVELDGVVGRIDAVIDGVLCDIKSCSSIAFKKFETGKILTDDAFGYIAQLHGYRTATGIKRAAFIPVDKTLGKLTVFELPQDIQYDVKKRIQLVRSALANDVEPDRCFDAVKPRKDDKSGNLVLGTTCSYCSHKFRCWADCNEGKGLQTRYYSGGPKFFTLIKKEPRLKDNGYKQWEEFPIKEDS